jgi:glycosyltransferase involved in cell wall biosynthesis
VATLENTGAQVRVLLVTASSPDAEGPGGVAMHVAALASHAPRGVLVRTAYPEGGMLHVEDWAPRRLAALLPLGHEPEGASLERAVLAAAVASDTDVLHVQSPLLGPEALLTAARSAGLALACTLHDHSLVCENYELLEGGVRFCNVPTDLVRCNRCLAATRARAPFAVVEHRTRMRRFVEGVDAFVAPSRSALELTERVHPGIAARTRIVPWGVPEPEARCTASALAPGPLRFAVVGAWAPVKGIARLPVLLDACRGLDVEFHLFGVTDGASRHFARASTARVVVHGAYPRQALATRLRRAGCHAAVLPAVGAESFSLTLSEVVAAGLPVLASDLGALGERVREGGLGFVFDPWAPHAFGRLVARLSRDRAELEAAAARVRALPVRTEVDMAEDHAALWAALARDRRSRRLAPALDAHERGEALRTFRDGEARAAAQRKDVVASTLAAVARAVRRSDAYRDLPLRRLLPERARKRIEAAMQRAFQGRR